ncbi:DUF2608 domain-containing protein [Chlamydiales bacterium]|nr:DUF2608 domain-containing protein [Chlamydiales bacterium]
MFFEFLRAKILINLLIKHECFRLLVVSLLFFNQSIHSEEGYQKFTDCSGQDFSVSGITSIYSFSDIQPELDGAGPETLVIFDVDDVLITYNDMVLRPCGAHFLPESWNDIDSKKIPYLMSIMLNEGEIILVDPSTPRLLNNLRDRGVKIIALTAARTGKFGVIEKAEDWRLKILKQFNFDFYKSFPKNQVIYFSDEGKKENEYSIFKDGVLFLGDEKNTKGALLVQFLDRIQWKPKKVIFFDDKMSYLISVETALNKAKIPFQGYQYKGVERLPGVINKQIAEFQFTYLLKEHKWLSDSEAQKKNKCLLEGDFRL